jgi:hypothetical protein
MSKTLYEELKNLTYILHNGTFEGSDEYALYEAINSYHNAQFDAMTEDEQIEELGSYGLSTEPEDLEESIDEYLQNQDGYTIYQTFIVDEYSFELLKKYGEICHYDENLDLHFWHVMHFGTSWELVMTNKKVNFTY